MDKSIKLAKPSGITLERHILDVMSEVEAICEHIPCAILKYRQIVGEDLKARLITLAELHDYGKGSCDIWQNACIKDYNNYSLWKQDKNGSFKEYSKEHREEAGKHLRQAGVRHEFYSLLWGDKCKLPLPLMAAIAAHHSKLGWRHSDLWERNRFSEFWKKFKTESFRVLESEDFDKLCSYKYEYDGIRGLLQLADHRASAKEESDDTSKLISFSYKFPYYEKRGIQKLIEKYWNKDILLVRAPTGAGKTDAALLWGKKQIESKRADRIIFAMPTMFTANALAISVSESLSETSIYHSSAWFTKYSKVKQGEITLSTALAQHKMARLLATPLVVCTIDHILLSLTQTREEHHLINFNLANSCVVIDEADFYDDFTLANILFLLKVLNKWQVPVLIMSASIPESLLPLYKATGYKVSGILEDKHNIDYTRKRVWVKSIHDYDTISNLDNVVDECLKLGNGIFYCNTVEKAIEFYNHIKNIASDKGIDIPIILYHSRFTNIDKAQKETELISALGKNAWKNGVAKGIAVLTQIGEISINISTELMVSEICPIDRLIQRTGRLCRFSKKTGTLHVIVPQKNGAPYPAPYGSFNRKAMSWEPCASFLSTLHTLKTGNYASDDLIQMLNNVYSTQMDFSSKAIDNARMLEDCFKTNWLLTPVGVTKEDDENTNFWRSRDIDSQEKVFIELPTSTQFVNYSEYMEYELTSSINLPSYLVAKARKMNRIDSIPITINGNMDLNNIYVIRQGFYNYDIGIDLTENDNFL